MSSIISKPIPSSEYYFEKYLSPNKRADAEAMTPRIVDFEVTSKCTGACTYCYASSPFFKGEDSAVYSYKDNFFGIASDGKNDIAVFLAKFSPELLFQSDLFTITKHMITGL